MPADAAEVATEVIETAVAGEPATDRVAALQGLLQEHGLAAYIVPTGDAHNSEYVAERDMRRVFVSPPPARPGHFSRLRASRPAS